MINTYQIYLISDSTGEPVERIFLALKAQFLNIEYKVHSYTFTRTENQILKILEDAKKKENFRCVADKHCCRKSLSQRWLVTQP